MLQTECESGFVVSIPLCLSLVPQSSKQQTDRDDFFRHGRFHCHNSFVNPRSGAGKAHHRFGLQHIENYAEEVR